MIVISPIGRCLSDNDRATRHQPMEPIMRNAVTRREALVGAASLGVATTRPFASARAESYPARPLHLLVGGGAGSVPDMVARLIGDKLSLLLGQPVVIEDRPGAGGIIAMQGLVGSSPDGYTLALATMSQAVFNSYLFTKLPYDPLRDLEPICPLVLGAMAVAAHPSVQAGTFGDLVSLAKARPGKFSIGTASNGSPPDVVARLLTHVAGIDLAFIPFRTGPEGLTAVMRGDVQLFVDGPPIIAPQFKAGAVKVLVVTGRVREPELPDVQTIAEAGFPSAQAEAWLGLVARAGTPREIVARLNHEIEGVLAASDVQQRLSVLSFRPFIATSDEFANLIREDHKRWGPIIAEAGIRLD